MEFLGGFHRLTSRLEGSEARDLTRHVVVSSVSCSALLCPSHSLCAK